MADFRYTPTHLDGVDLTGAAFASVEFLPENGPLQTQQVAAISAAVVGLGDRFVSQQPEGGTWMLKIIAASRDESDKLTIAQTFSTERKLVYLRADDGDGVNWRIACAVTKLEGGPRKPLLWIATIDVPNTVWEKNTATTTAGNFNAMSGDSAVQAVTLTGDRKARATMAIAPQTVKGGDPSKDFTISYRGFLQNLGPLPWNNLPMAVTDALGTPGAGIDTTTLIQDAGTAGTLAGAIIAGDAVINLTPGHGFAAGPQFFYIPAEGGNGIEQIFGILAGDVIGVTERGIGGTAADAHSNLADVYKSSMMADGSDMRLFIDGVEAERWIGEIETTGTQVWANIDMPPQPSLTLRDDLGSGDTEMFITEGVGALRDRDILSIGAEMIAYTARDVGARECAGLKRGIWISGAVGAAASAGDTVRVVHHRFVLAFGRYGLGAPPEPIERRPAIDLEQSTNRTWYYGDQVSDPSTIFHDPTQPGRTAQWSPDFEVDPDDQNNARPLWLTTSEQRVTFADTATLSSIEGRPRTGRLTLRLPQGIKAAAAAITYAWTADPMIRAQIFARDAAGTEFNLTDRHDGGATSTFTPTALFHELTLAGVRAAVCGELSEVELTSIALNSVGPPVEHVTQKFILDQETPISDVMAWCRKAGAGDNFTFAVQILDDSGGATPETGRVLWKATAGNLTAAGLGLPSNWEAWNQGSNKFTLQAGTYYLQIILTAWTSGALEFPQPGGLRTKHNRLRADTGAGVADQINNVLGFAIVHKLGGPIQPENENFATNDISTFDKLILVMNPATVPFAFRPTQANVLGYHAFGSIANGDTGDEMGVDIWLDVLTETLSIDTENRRVIRTEAGWEDESYYAITPGDPTDWLPLDPLVGAGFNDITYSDPDMTDTDLIFTHRDAKI